MKDKWRTLPFETAVIRVSVLNIFGNIFLSVIKFIAGFLASSGAMISDAINSLSDVLSSIVVIVGVKFSAQKSDRQHPYGHERFECVTAIVLACVLLLTAAFIGYEAIEMLTEGSYNGLKIPGTLAIVVAVISMAVKEVMFWVTRATARRRASSALMGVAWDNRCDVFSSLCVLISILGIKLGAPILEVFARLIICIFIFRSAYDIFSDAVRKMVDHSCSEETEREIYDLAAAQAGVLRVDMIKTRIFGNKIYVDIEISADPTLTLSEGHDIALCVHDAVEDKFQNVKHIMVHVNPYGEE